MSAVQRSLFDNGHNVILTVFTPFLDNKRVKYTEVNSELPTNVEMDAVESFKIFGNLMLMVPFIMIISRIFLLYRL